MHRSGLRRILRGGAADAAGPVLVSRKVSLRGVHRGWWIAGALMVWGGWAIGTAEVHAQAPVAEAEVVAAEDVSSPAEVPKAPAAPKADRAARVIEEAAGEEGLDAATLRQNARRRARARVEIVEPRVPVDDGGGIRYEDGQGWDAPTGWGGYPWSWGWSPWYGVPQTRVWREYPPPITHTPRLGLQYNYPWAYQMGIRIPDDSSPLVTTPNLGPFVGVVQAAKEELLRMEEEARREVNLQDQALGWMQTGQYSKAGKLLAAAFKASSDPSYPLLLTEVFFALDKPAHAEAILRHALRSSRALRALPAEVASHFADEERFEKELGALADGGKYPLLAGYLLVHSRNPERGVKLLGELSSGSPEDRAASQLYRHYLGRVFTE